MQRYPRGMQRRFPAFIVNLVLSCVTIAVVLVLLEGGLRVTGYWKVPRLNPPIYRVSDTPGISYELIPSHSAMGYGERVTTNALGFRSPEVPSDVRPLVILGDSLVFGYGVRDDETLGTSLQTLLLSQHVLSAGVSGYNIAQERTLFAEKLAPLKPVGLVLVFMSNDVEETYVLDDEGFLRRPSDRGTYADRLQQAVHAQSRWSLAYIKAFLQAHSVLVDMLEKKTKSLPFRSRVAQSDIHQDPMKEDQLLSYMNELRHLAADAGPVPKLFVFWPENNLRLRTRERLKPYAASLGFEVVDLYDTFGNSYESLGWDGHPSAKTLWDTANVLWDAMKASPTFGPLLSK